MIALDELIGNGTAQQASNEGSARMKVLHYRTSGTSAPSASNMEIGEIALSTDSTNPKMYIKNNGGSVSEFVGKDYIDSSVATESGRSESAYAKKDETIALGGRIADIEGRKLYGMRSRTIYRTWS